MLDRKELEVYIGRKLTDEEWKNYCSQAADILVEDDYKYLDE